MRRFECSPSRKVGRAGVTGKSSRADADDEEKDPVALESGSSTSGVFFLLFLLVVEAASATVLFLFFWLWRSRFLTRLLKLAVRRCGLAANAVIIVMCCGGWGGLCCFAKASSRSLCKDFCAAFAIVFTLGREKTSKPGQRKRSNLGDLNSATIGRKHGPSVAWASLVMPILALSRVPNFCLGRCI